MELLSVIRRWHYRDHFSIRQISRRTGLSRNTVRKYLRSDTVEPKFNIPDRSSKLDPYADKLSQMLRQEAGKSRKQKRTTKQLHADLAALGYDGSYNRVAAFARDWKAARQQEQKTCGRGVFVPLAFLPGEAFQFDWSEDWAIIAGERTKLQVAHFKLSYSRAFILRAYPQQTHEMLFDAHNHAFVSWAACRGGHLRQYANGRRQDRPRQGAPGQRPFLGDGQPFPIRGRVLQSSLRVGEGQIEKNVQDARHRLWQPLPDFPSLAALNDWLETRCRELWAQTLHGSQPGAIVDVWAEEVGCLMQLSRPFDGFVEYAKRVSPTCLVEWTAIATACRRRSPIVRSACGCIPSASSSSARGRSSASIVVSLPALTNGRAPQRFTTGGTISRSFNASLEPCVTARLSSNCRPPSGLCNSACSRRRAATARWSNSGPRPPA